MLARQIMQKNLVTVPFKSSVQEAAAKMKEHNVGSVLVLEDGAKLKGMITDRDIAIEVVANNKDPRLTCVCDVMSQDIITAEADVDIDSAMRIMNRARVMRLPLMENGKLVGIISLADLAVAMKEHIDQFMGLEEAALKG
ncbi:MAG: CBS domain-containing protein [Alphaproteobacteria bacterium]|uniref:CBS domain-containing protein n=1 Tax=Candidatus Nitrobium versatile TaxID=2884831 RepID=A0A953JBB1_9BACT|nr:CBS domain-containing protein [Candidatus Nitrobium versatile]